MEKGTVTGLLGHAERRMFFFSTTNHHDQFLNTKTQNRTASELLNVENNKK